MMTKIISRFTLAMLLFAMLSNAFSIISYNTSAAIQHDGSLSIKETMLFNLDQAYNEGYRSIRGADFGSLSDIVVNSARVNGQPVQYELVKNGDRAEIVWKKTYVGDNLVELDYSIKNRTQLWDDFAKVCYEHYGDNWAVPAQKFHSEMTLPPGSAGKDMNYEVYSSKKGTATISNLTIIIDMENVPSGNFIGGCYLFARDSVQTSNVVNGSALAILQDERKAYDSETILAPQEPLPYAWFCCLPAFLLAGVIALSTYYYEKRRPRLPESILPPEKEEPAIVSALVRNEVHNKELVAATLLDLINRNIVDIVELEKPGEKTAEMKRERTILMLKKRPAGLKDYENSVIDLVFSGTNEVDLDAKMAQYDAIQTKIDAQASPLYQQIEKFNTDFPKQVDSLFIDPELKRLKSAKIGKMGMGSFLTFLAVVLVIGSCGVLIYSFDYISWGKWLEFSVVLVTLPLTYAFAIYALYKYWSTPALPKTNIEKYGKWDAFYRGLKSSRIKEYPPASAVIWGDILVYAAALGMADKVKQHLSELSVLDPKVAARVQSMDHIAIRSMAFYSSVHALHNLGTIGNRSGVVAGSGGYGGFSMRSSGGWSSHGGGGFSGGGHSGGGGFR